MQVFGSLKLSMALLGSSWPLLGPIWSQNGPQNGPQNYPKGVKKIVQNTTPKKVNFKLILGPKMDPKMGHLGGPGTVPGSRSYFKSSCFQDGSKMAQDGLK